MSCLAIKQITYQGVPAEEHVFSAPDKKFSTGYHLIVERGSGYIRRAWYGDASLQVTSWDEIETGAPLEEVAFSWTGPALGG